MRKFKACVSVLLSCFTFLALTFGSYAVELDGVLNNSEWLEGEIFTFESPDGFNNEVNFAYMRIIPRTAGNQLYLCVSMKVDEMQSTENSAILISFNGGEEICLKGDGSSSYDKNLYNVEHAMAYDDSSADIVYEIMLGVKHGIPENSFLTVRLCDCDGSPSNEFRFDFDTAGETLPTAERDEPQKTPSQKEDKTRKTVVTKTKKENTDSFTFKKAESDDCQQNIHSDNETTSTADLTPAVNDNSVIRKKVLAVTAILCAVCVSGCAIYAQIKKNDKDDSDS